MVASFSNHTRLGCSQESRGIAGQSVPFPCEPIFAGFDKLGSLKCPCDRMVVESLLLTQNQVHDPATSDVRTFASAVAQDVGVGASSFFKGVGQDGKVLK